MKLITTILLLHFDHLLGNFGSCLSRGRYLVVHAFTATDATEQKPQRHEIQKICWQPAQSFFLSGLYKVSGVSEDLKRNKANSAHMPKSCFLSEQCASHFTGLQQAFHFLKWSKTCSVFWSCNYTDRRVIAIVKLLTR